MKKTLYDLWGKNRKVIIAAIHLLPLPGSPNYDVTGGMKKIIQRAKDDSKILADNGVHAFLFTNEADVPYLLRLGEETIAAFSVVVQEVMQEYDIPFGINALIDAYAGLCIAHATGASFVRGIFAGVYISDMGVIESSGPRIFRVRAALGNNNSICLIHNLSSIMGRQLVERPPDAEAASILEHHIEIDGFTLPAKDYEYFKKVKAVAPGLPLLVGSGVNAKNLKSLLEVSDGIIVATTLRKDEKIFNEVDPDRTKAFMKVFEQYLRM